MALLEGTNSLDSILFDTYAINSKLFQRMLTLVFLWSLLHRLQHLSFLSLQLLPYLPNPVTIFPISRIPHPLAPKDRRSPVHLQRTQTTQTLRIQPP